MESPCEVVVVVGCSGQMALGQEGSAATVKNSVESPSEETDQRWGERREKLRKHSCVKKDEEHLKRRESRSTPPAAAALGGQVYRVVTE